MSSSSQGLTAISEIDETLGEQRETFAEISAVHTTLDTLQRIFTTIETRIKDCVIAGQATLRSTADCTDFLRQALSDSFYDLTLALGEQFWLRTKVHATRDQLIILNRQAWQQELHNIKTAVSDYARNIENVHYKLIATHSYLLNYYRRIRLRDTEENEIKLLLRITDLLIEHTDFVTLNSYILPVEQDDDQ
jgi:hypothetical protein